MSAIKQNRITEQPYYGQQQTVDLTQQERKALSLVWHDDRVDEQKPARLDSDTAHCAVLGYN